MNVYITTPSSYTEITQGMCGNRDGNKDNDIKMGNFLNGGVTPVEFADEWKYAK